MNFHNINTAIFLLITVKLLWNNLTLYRNKFDSTSINGLVISNDQNYEDSIMSDTLQKVNFFISIFALFSSRNI